MTFNAPWGESTNSFQITTVPGRKFEQSLVCPAMAPEDVAVQFQVNWPDQPEGEEVYLLCDFRPMNPKAATKAEGFSLNSYRRYQDHRLVYQHDLNQESGMNVYLIDVKNNRATPCSVAADGSIEQINLEKLTWSPTVEILQGEYQAPTIYLIQKNELSKLTDINSMFSTKVIRFGLKGYELPEVDYPIPSAGLIVSPFKKLEIEPSMVVDKSPSQLKQIHGLLTVPLTKTYSATEKDQPNVWELNIPGLFPITAESGSLSSVQ